MQPFVLQPFATALRSYPGGKWGGLQRILLYCPAGCNLKPTYFSPDQLFKVFSSLERQAMRPSSLFFDKSFFEHLLEDKRILPRQGFRERALGR